jgi:hypothetical protein
MLNKITICALLVAGYIIFASFNNISEITAEVSYPEGYRSWMHVKSMIITEENAKSDHFVGYHHIYANDKAMQGYQTGKFPNGSVIVADFLEMEKKEGVIEEGNRKFIDVMVKDDTLYKSTGGWGYGEFDSNSKEIRLVTLAQAVTSCFNCHVSKADTDYVFSSYRK